MVFCSFVVIILYENKNMEMYENMYKSICRVCLKQNDGENMIPLIDSTNADGLSCFGKSVLFFASVDIKSDDVFPHSMCNDCLNCLKQAICFKLKCETSDKQLKNLANYCFTEREIQEKVAEYTMFKSYFPNEDLQKIPGCDIKCESNPQVFMQTIEKANLDVEVTVSQDSFSDNFMDKLEVDEHGLSYCDGKSSNEQEDADAILDSIEQLIESHADISSLQFKSFFKKETLTFNCNVCHKTLANKKYYDNHMQRHNGFKHVCEHCGKGFAVRAEMRMHQVAVHGIGPYLQCPQCPYKAPRKFSLIEHERIHTGERPYTCEKCGLTFRRRFLWKKHLIYHTEKSIQCNLCPRKFYLRSAMLAHCNNVHERMYVYACNKCGATYAKASTVRQHLLEKHGVPRKMQGKVIRINKQKGNSVRIPE